MEIYYSKEHEWVKIDGDTGTIGITEYAVEQLGDITYIEIPEEGDEITQDEVFSTIESVKAASDIFAPLSGTITKVNEALEDEPEIINENPLEKGWIAQIKIKDPSEKDNLLNEQEYKNFLKELE